MRLQKNNLLLLTFLTCCLNCISLLSAKPTSQDILDAINTLKSIQSDKLNKILIHQKELDREYQSTVDSVEDLKDEISNITGIINQKFRWMKENSIDYNTLSSEIGKVVKKIDDQEKRIARVIKNLPKVQVPSFGRNGGNSNTNTVSRTDRPSNSELTTSENSVETTESPQIKTSQSPSSLPKTYTRDELKKLFKFETYDKRIRSSSWSAKRTNKNDKNGAVAYTKEFSMNTAMMFNITFKVNKLTSMEIGVCTEKLLSTGSVWLGNSYKASVWYSGGAYFNSGRKSINWPTYQVNDLITVSYRPQTGLVSYLQNNEFVGSKTFKNRDEIFMFCVTLYEDKDAVQIMKYYTLDFNNNRG